MEAFLIILLVIGLIVVVILLLIDYLTPPTVKGFGFTKNHLCNDPECTTTLKFQLEKTNEFTLSRVPLEPSEDGSGTEELVSYSNYPSTLPEFTGPFADRIQRSPDDSFKLELLKEDIPEQGTYSFSIHATRIMDHLTILGDSVKVPLEVDKTVELLVENDLTQSLVAGGLIGKVYGVDENGESAVVGTDRIDQKVTVSGPGTEEHANYRLCAGTTLVQLSIGSIGIFYDDKQSHVHTNTDPTREHAEEVHVVIERGDEVLHESVASANTVLELDLPVDGPSPLVVKTAMISGDEGNFQEGYSISWEWSFIVTCPG